MKKIIIILTLLFTSNALAQNFVASDSSVPDELIDAAEKARVESSKYWTNGTLRRWSAPCTITWTNRDKKNGGGSTKFRFDDGEVFGWRMLVTGNKETVLKDVIPHEVDHTVRASLIRKPIVRWLDEGCSILRESPEEQLQYTQFFENKQSKVPFWNSINKWNYEEDANQEMRHYGFGLTVVRHILQEFGEQRGKQILLKLMASRNPQEDWLQITGQSLGVTKHNWEVAYRPPSPQKYTRKPVIRFITASWCPPCKRLKADIDAARIRNELPYEVIQEQYNLLYHGSISIPFCIAPNGRSVVGYSKGWENWHRWALANTGTSEPVKVIQEPPVTPKDPAPIPIPDERLETRIETLESGVNSIRKAIKDTKESSEAFDKKLEGLSTQFPDLVNSFLEEKKTTEAYREEQAKEREASSSGLNERLKGITELILKGNEKTAPVENLILGMSQNTAILTALGVPTAGAGALGLWGLGVLLRRRKKRREETTPIEKPETGGGQSQPSTDFRCNFEEATPAESTKREMLQRETEEARQLLQLGRMEGRDPVLDAFSGMSFFDEIKFALENPETSEDIKDYLKKLMDKVRANVDSVAPVSATQPYSS